MTLPQIAGFCFWMLLVLFLLFLISPVCKMPSHISHLCRSEPCRAALTSAGSHDSMKELLCSEQLICPAVESQKPFLLGLEGMKTVLLVPIYHSARTKTTLPHTDRGTWHMHHRLTLMCFYFPSSEWRGGGWVENVEVNLQLATQVEANKRICISPHSSVQSDEYVNLCVYIFLHSTHG